MFELVQYGNPVTGDFGQGMRVPVPQSRDRFPCPRLVPMDYREIFQRWAVEYLGPRHKGGSGTAMHPKDDRLFVVANLQQYGLSRVIDLHGLWNQGNLHLGSRGRNVGVLEA